MVEVSSILSPECGFSRGNDRKPGSPKQRGPAEVIALREIDQRIIGKGSTGSVCSDIQKAYSQIVHGKDHNYKYWLDYINTSQTTELIERKARVI